MEPLDPNRIKAMMIVESGSVPSAFKKDPIQTANEGDYALDILAGKTDELFTKLLPEDIKNNFASKHHTPRVAGRWDYSKSDMDPETSIEGGILHLIMKNAILGTTYEYKEIGPLKSYVVQAGDSLWGIAVEHDTSIDVLKKYSHMDANVIHRGQKLFFKEVEAIVPIVGWKGWDKATEDYNGGGVDDYLERVKQIEEQYLN